jgi:hypothetical protein
MIQYALITKDTLSITELLKDLSAWVRDDLLPEPVGMIHEQEDQLVLTHANVQFLLKPFEVDGGTISALGLYPRETYHEQTSALCWDILAAVNLWHPMKTWLASSTYSFAAVKLYPSLEGLRIDGQDGHVMSADDFSALIGS